jgi:hypothetical protein
MDAGCLGQSNAMPQTFGSWPSSPSHPTTIHDYRWLIGPAGAEWIARATEVAESGASAVALAQTLRRDLSAAQVHLVLEQVELRAKARDKFSAAARMFFTRRGYEQATDEVTARHKARRFPTGQPLADLCCGIGGDLMALAERGPAAGVDRDPAMALVSAANCRAMGVGEAGEGGARAIVADVTTIDLVAFAAWHIDPDRRPQGRRTTRVELHEPNVEALEGLLAQQPDGAIKLAPAATLPDSWSQHAELEWISRDGECRQLVAWFGALAARPAQRLATVLNGATAHTVVGSPGVPLEPADAIGRYVYEPDAAVLAADLAGSLAAEHDLAAVTTRGGYLTGDRLVTDSALVGFDVIESLPYHANKVRDLLRARGIGRLELKKRDSDTDLEKVRQELRVAGDNTATLLLARVGKSLMAILAQRV